ncbi:cyclic pyranopterin monophosphate synthase MoaC [Thermoplasma sp.]|uniref:cyclic pyranopterin monophosphate synthase MoaC n=1 Tax=Thermoplasma sp. TaxID=1973142 RepID=UPI001274D8CA|nr:cyclic pyranopterin monophosphate synthase MoaC [Thermoplasma sp.]KAA8923423.1 MAG: cyclic pyranopterin monophosphate synthase MoaC [Thermoplasma sp.]
MINISEKAISSRTATAKGRIHLKKSTVQAIRDRKVKKGDVLEVSRVVGTQHAKDTFLQIPYCHNIPIEGVDVDFVVGDDYVEVSCTLTTTYKTGIEMEAISCVSGALINIWDMVKYLEKDEGGNYPETRIEDIHVVEKRKTPI